MGTEEMLSFRLLKATCFLFHSVHVIHFPSKSRGVESVSLSIRWRPTYPCPPIELRPTSLQDNWPSCWSASTLHTLINKLISNEILIKIIVNEDKYYASQRKIQLKKLLLSNSTVALFYLFFIFKSINTFSDSVCTDYAISVTSKTSNLRKGVKKSYLSSRSYLL